MIAANGPKYEVKLEWKKLNFGRYEVHPSFRSIFYEDFVFQQLVDQRSTIVDQIWSQSITKHFFETLHRKFMNKTDHAFFNSKCKIILYTNPQKYVWSLQSVLSQQVLPFGQQKVDFWNLHEKLNQKVCSSHIGPDQDFFEF